MAQIDLPYVNRYRDRHGHLRHYFRRPGFKSVALPGLPGSQEFMQAYQQAEMAARPTESKAVAGSITALIDAYYLSDNFKALQPDTQRNYKRILNAFLVTFKECANLPAKRLETRHLYAIFDKMADKPEARNNLLKRLRSVCKFAVDRGLLATDPTAGIRLAKRRTDGFRAWTDNDIEKFRAFWPEGSRARLALALLLYTGQRRSDVVRMGWQHVRDGQIAVTQDKRNPGAPAKVLKIKIHDALQAELDRLAKTNLTFLMTEYGKPMTKVGFTNWFRDCAKKAGLPANSSPHGLRKAASRWLAESGCSTLEIAAITGHSSLREVERYTQSARQEHLANTAISKIAHKK